jgi:hypothetical protein
MAFFVLQNPDSVAGEPYLNSNREADRRTVWMRSSVITRSFGVC